MTVSWLCRGNVCVEEYIKNMIISFSSELDQFDRNKKNTKTTTEYPSYGSKPYIHTYTHPTHSTYTPHTHTHIYPPPNIQNL